MKKKRYWIKNCRDGEDYMVDGYSKKEIAQKMQLPQHLIKINRFRFLESTGKTIYDIPTRY